MNIGIAGAGLSGRLLAFALASQGHQVSVFDPAPSMYSPVAAGWTAAGMLSPVAELESGDDNVFQLGVRSLALWAHIVPRLQQEVELHFNGSLLVAHRGDEGAAERLVSLLKAKAPQQEQPQSLSRSDLNSMEPAIQGPSHTWLLANEGQIHTVQAMRALAESAPNVQWHWSQPVTSLTPHTIHTSTSSHTFDWVFDTRGVGARDKAIHDASLLACQNVRGVRGEIFWVKAPGVKLNRPVRLLHPRYRVYIVPRAPDIIVVGASEIESEDRSAVSVRTTVELLAAAHSILPEMAEGRIIHTDVNLRPALVDNFPRIETEDGLTRINGLFRHGWLIAPAVIENALKSVFSSDYSLSQA
ncbi:MAG: FAD-dependent oxidoreductase [Alcaligenaceae bacterium]|nr:FAD-dependent oxidoreductase [Alcaligenaceae bacterium]